ncbi:MAG: hypothetical protein QOI95_329 [Acidimicrobiaceae bacterium]|jgi:hypothetical protein
MVDGVSDEPVAEDSISDDQRTGERERERLRAVLEAPESIETGLRSTLDLAELIETGEAFERHGRRAQPEPRELAGDDDVARRLQQLTTRVEAVAGLVETLFDRMASVGNASSSLTAEELADIASRMVRLIESRLESQSEHLESVIGALGARPHEPNEDGANVNAGFGMLDDYMAMIGRALLDMKKSIAHLESPADLQEMAILAHFDRWFEETNSRQATDVEHVRRDLHRFDEALIEMKTEIAELPGREALRDLYQTLSQQFYQAQLSQRDGLVELQAAVKDLPEGVALQQPIARIDATILQQLDAKLAETSEGLAQKVEALLASRVQRFEALSQAMMTMVGDPVDSLNTKLGQVVRAQEAAPNVLQSIGELTQIQGQLAMAITSLRQEGVAREALLREVLEKVDRLSGDARPPAR